MALGMRRSGPVGSRSPAGVFRHPVHPALAHLPVGAWACSLVFDVASQFVRRPGYLALGSQWLIAIGLLGAVVAAGAGFVDLVAIERGPGAFRTACAHMVINATLIFAYAGSFAWRYRSHLVEAPVGAGTLALSAACAVTLGASCYLGGKLAHGTGVTAPVDAARRDAGAAPDPASGRPAPRHRADSP